MIWYATFITSTFPDVFGYISRLPVLFHWSVSLLCASIIYFSAYANRFLCLLLQWNLFCSKMCTLTNVSCTGAGHEVCEEKRTSSSKGGRCVEIGTLLESLYCLIASQWSLAQVSNFFLLFYTMGYGCETT